MARRRTGMGVKRPLSLGVCDRQGKMCSMVVITFKSVRRVIKIFARSKKINIRENWEMHQIHINQRLYKRDYFYELP